MELLWRPAAARDGRAGPGPRPALSVDMIVDEAIALADARGMTGLSMRAVGERFGRTGMSLYTYVANKYLLLELMYDRVHAELPTRYDLGPGWRPALRAWAGDAWGCYLRHPWALEVSQARPVLGPHQYAVLETVTTILDAAGLPPRAVWRVAGALSHFVRGTAQTVAEARQAAAATGVPEDDWWYARSALLPEVAPDFASRFPTLTRLSQDGAFEPSDESAPYLEQEARETFDVGLGVLLDGIEAAARAAARSPGPDPVRRRPA
jgi:AcrR family transcriptional regulator